MKKTFALFLFVSLYFTGFSQLQKFIHQTFELNDAKTVKLDLFGEYEVQAWAGNTILTETTIKLYDASTGILDHFIEAGRYNIEAKGEGGFISLISKDMERKPIVARKSGGSECYEEITLRVFIPDTFEKSTEEYTWVLPEKEEKDN